MTATPLRIAVGLKATPAPDDVAALALSGQLRVDRSGRALRLDHVPIGVHGFDEQALGLVAALDRAGKGDGVAISVDPSAPTAVFGRAFELGLGEGHLIDSGGSANDAMAVARLLAAAASRVGADLVVVGDASSDSGAGVVGGLVAALLDRPCLAGVADLDVDVDARIVTATRRRADGGAERLAAALPAVVTVRSDGWEPLRPRAQDVLAARDLTPVVVADDGSGAGGDGVAVPATLLDVQVDDRARVCEQVAGSPAEIAGALLERLRAALATERPAPTAAVGLGAAAGAAVFPDTPDGRVAAAAAAVARSLPIVAGCTEVERAGDGMVVARRTHGGAVVERSRVGGAAVLTLGSSTSIPGSDSEASATDPRITAIAIDASLVEPLGRARLVVGVGAGVGTDETFERVQRLAERLGGVVGGSKLAVDRGWVPPSHKIGLTGADVAPDVYLALGISGASQHMAGCAEAGLVVAVNLDARAPIFRYAGVGVVGDASAVVDALIGALETGP